VNTWTIAAGVAVTNVGHSHPKIVSAISEQAGLLLHTSNLYSIDWQQQLAQKLTRLAGMERAFFNNSGAEANETALKLARLWLAQRHRATAGGGHGERVSWPHVGTLSASDGPAVRLGFSKLPGISSRCRSVIWRRWIRCNRPMARASWRF
jgi:acetylornithine aminotransferase